MRSVKFIPEVRGLKRCIDHLMRSSQKNIPYGLESELKCETNSRELNVYFQCNSADENHEISEKLRNLADMNAIEFEDIGNVSHGIMYKHIYKNTNPRKQSSSHKLIWSNAEDRTADSAISSERGPTLIKNDSFSAGISFPVVSATAKHDMSACFPKNLTVTIQTRRFSDKSFEIVNEKHVNQDEILRQYDEWLQASIKSSKTDIFPFVLMEINEDGSYCEFVGGSGRNVVCRVYFSDELQQFENDVENMIVHFHQDPVKLSNSLEIEKLEIIETAKTERERIKTERERIKTERESIIQTQKTERARIRHETEKIRNQFLCQIL